MNIINSNDGIAYGYVAMLLCLVFCAAIWIGLSESVNHITDNVNAAVASGDMSEQSATAYDWSVRVWTWLLPVGILGMLAMWGLTRANLRGD